MRLPGFGAEAQQRLAGARVLVVGAGGLGSPVLLYLAAAGIATADGGLLGIVDDDAVDLTNLHRQVVHGTTDLGRAKVDSAAERIAELDPGVRVRRHRSRVTADTATDLVAAYDLVVDGSDNFATRYLVSDACEVAGIPCVWGSVLRFAGQVSVFWAGHGPTYRDLHPMPPPPGSVPSCADAGVVGSVCGTIGSLMATEAVKVLTGVGRPLLGRVLLHDALAMTWRTVEVAVDPGRAPVTAVTGEPDEGVGAFSIEPAELAGRLAERAAGGPDFVLVDVREPAERAVAAIPGSIRVPRELLLAGHADSELPAGMPVVLHCKTGGRSAHVLAVLRAGGRDDVVHLRGGITAWLAHARG